MNQNEYQAALHSMQTEAAAILHVCKTMDESIFAAACDLIESAPKIFTCASGTSGIAAKKAAHSFCCINQPAFFLSPSEAVHGGLGAVTPDDVVIFVTNGGKTAELLPVLAAVKKIGASVIAITGNPDSPFTRAAKVTIPLEYLTESDPLKVMATSSFIATVTIFDAILSALILRTGYTREDFGIIHPGGAVGDLLNQ